MELDYTKAASGTRKPPAGISFAINSKELPQAYDENRLSLLPRSPKSLFAYWDIPRDIAPGHQLTLRLYSVESGASVLQQELAVQREANNWYINIPDHGGVYFACLGYVIEGKFVSWLTSNSVQTPAARISARVDPAWPPLELPHSLSGFNSGTSWFSGKSG